LKPGLFGSYILKMLFPRSLTAGTPSIGPFDGESVVKRPSLVGGTAFLADQFSVVVVLKLSSASATFAEPKSPFWLGLSAVSIVAVSSHKPSVSVGLRK